MESRLPDGQIKKLATDLERFPDNSLFIGHEVVTAAILDLRDAWQEIERLKESLLCIAVLPNATSRSIADYSDIAIKALNPIYAKEK